MPLNRKFNFYPVFQATGSSLSATGQYVSQSTYKPGFSVNTSAIWEVLMRLA
jgi:hypothetical protein